MDVGSSAQLFTAPSSTPSSHTSRLTTHISLLLALAAILGVLAGGDGVLVPAAAAGVAVGAGLAIAVAGRRRRALWQPALVVAALALGLWRYDATRVPAGPAGLPYYVGHDVTLVGTVAAEPEPLDRGQNLRVAVETLSTTGAGGAGGAGGATARSGVVRRVDGLILVHTGTLAALSYGDRLALAGTLAAPPDLPGAAPGSYRAYLAAQGVYAVLDYPRLRRLGSGAGSPLLALAIALRQLLEIGIRRILPGPEGALLMGILLGTRTRALGALTTPFIATGMIHVVAIDGIKIAVVAGTAYGLSRRLLGLRRALWPALAVLLLYVLVTGATPAGLRAALMWTLALVALRVGRRSDALTSLALAAAVLVLASPRIVADLGFELSIAGTAAIVLLAPGIERRLGRVPAIGREAIAVTLAAQVGTLPLLVAGFGQVSLVSPLANALLLPLLGPIMALGLPAALAGAVIPPLGHALGLLVYPFLAVMIAGVQLLAHIPAIAVPAGAWPLLPVAGYYAAVGLAAWRPLRASGPHTGLGLVPAPRLPLRWAVRGALALLPATVAWQTPPAVYTLDVLALGNGQGELLTTPGGRTLLIDGGDTPSLLDAALGNRLPFWRPRLDLIALSDVDRGHVAGLRDLFDRYGVGRALDPGAVYPPADYALWRATLRDSGVPEAKLRTGARYRLDEGAVLDALLPDRLDPDNPPAPVALRLVVGRFALLVLNRAALVVVPALLQADGVRRDTVLVLPSGADPADDAALVRLIRPRLIVLPAPDDADADAMVARVARTLGAHVWQSAGGASLRVTTDGSRYAVTTRAL